MDPLPLGPLIQASYRTVRDEWERLIGAGALWLALLLLLDSILRLFDPGTMLPASDVADAPDSAVLSFAVQNGATLLAMAAVAVAWHRHVLRGAAAGDGVAPLDVTVLRYVGLTFLIALMVVLPVGVVLGLLMRSAGGLGAGLQLVALPLVLVGAVAWVRLNLVLPAVAIGDSRMTVRRSWERTRGHGFKLLAGFLMTSAPVALASLVAASLIAGVVGDTPILRALPKALLIVGNFLETALVTTFLSLAYRRLWDEQRGEAARA